MSIMTKEMYERADETLQYEKALEIERARLNVATGLRKVADAVGDAEPVDVSIELVRAKVLRHAAHTLQLVE